MSYYEKHKEIIKRRSQQQHVKTRTTLMELLGAKCQKCGYTDVRALQFHNTVESNPTKKFGGTTKMYHYYLHHTDEFKKKFTVVCANCKWLSRSQE